jgi:hypothetical protein
MGKPFNPLINLKKGSVKDKEQLPFKRNRKISGLRFNNGKKASFERGETAGFQLHLLEKNFEKNTRDTANRVLNTIMELTPKSSLER